MIEGLAIAGKKLRGLGPLAIAVDLEDIGRAAARPKICIVARPHNRMALAQPNSIAKSFPRRPVAGQQLLPFDPNSEGVTREDVRRTAAHPKVIVQLGTDNGPAVANGNCGTKGVTAYPVRSGELLFLDPDIGRIQRKDIDRTAAAAFIVVARRPHQQLGPGHSNSITPIVPGLGIAWNQLLFLYPLTVAIALVSVNSTAVETGKPVMVFGSNHGPVAIQRHGIAKVVIGSAIACRYLDLRPQKIATAFKDISRPGVGSHAALQICSYKRPFTRKRNTVAKLISRLSIPRHQLDRVDPHQRIDMQRINCICIVDNKVNKTVTCHHPRRQELASGVLCEEVSIAKHSLTQAEQPHPAMPVTFGPAPTQLHSNHERRPHLSSSRSLSNVDALLQPQRARLPPFAQGHTVMHHRSPTFERDPLRQRQLPHRMHPPQRHQAHAQLRLRSVGRPQPNPGLGDPHCEGKRRTFWTEFLAFPAKGECPCISCLLGPNHIQPLAC